MMHNKIQVVALKTVAFPVPSVLLSCLLWYHLNNHRLNVRVFRTQTLEESVLSEEKRLTVRGPSPDASPTCLPARVREIVTKNLSEGSEWPHSPIFITAIHPFDHF